MLTASELLLKVQLLSAAENGLQSSDQEVTAHLWFVYYQKEPIVTINAALLLLLISDKEMPELAADQRFHSVGLFIRIAEG